MCWSSPNDTSPTSFHFPSIDFICSSSYCMYLKIQNKYLLHSILLRHKYEVNERGKWRLRSHTTLFLIEVLWSAPKPILKKWTDKPEQLLSIYIVLRQNLRIVVYINVVLIKRIILLIMSGYIGDCIRTCIAISSSMIPPSLPSGPIFLFIASCFIHCPTESFNPGFWEQEFLYILNSLPDGSTNMPLSRISLYASGLRFHIDRHNRITLQNRIVF